MGTSSQDAPNRSPIEVPRDILEKVRARCLALPEATVRVDASRVAERSTAHSFEIRGRSFCLLVAVRSRADRVASLLVLRADPNERDALLAAGPPFFAPRGGRGRVGMWLTDASDWAEVGELVTESYRQLAPKKLTALLDGEAPRAADRSRESDSGAGE